MTEEITNLTKHTKLVDVMDEVKHLKTLIKKKSKRTEDLQKRMNNLEQHTRMDDVIITGLETKHQTCARARPLVETKSPSPEGQQSKADYYDSLCELKKDSAIKTGKETVRVESVPK